MLFWTYGGGAMKKSSVFVWHKRFRIVRTRKMMKEMIEIS